MFSSSSKKCKLLFPDTRQLVSWMRGHEGAISSLSVHSSGSFAISTSSDTAQLWNLDTFQRKRKLNVRQSVGIQKVRRHLSVHKHHIIITALRQSLITVFFLIIFGRCSFFHTATPFSAALMTTQFLLGRATRFFASISCLFHRTGPEYTTGHLLLHSKTLTLNLMIHGATLGNVAVKEQPGETPGSRLI